MKSLAKITQVTANILLILSAIGLILMTAIIGWQVFGRFVLNSSPSWSEQAALTLMIWFIFLGAAAGVKDRFHIRILAVQMAVSKPIRRYMRIAANVVVGLCGFAMLWWGGELVIRTWNHTIPSLGLPRGMAYLAIPISGLVIFLFSMERTLLAMFGELPDDDTLYDDKMHAGESL